MSLGGGGTIDGFALRCPGHAAHFDVRTGAVLDGPPDIDPEEPLATSAARVVDRIVEVSLAQRPALDLPEG